MTGETKTRGLTIFELLILIAVVAIIVAIAGGLRGCRLGPSGDTLKVEVLRQPNEAGAGLWYNMLSPTDPVQVVVNDASMGDILVGQDKTFELPMHEGENTIVLNSFGSVASSIYRFSVQKGDHVHFVIKRPAKSADGFPFAIQLRDGFKVTPVHQTQVKVLGVTWQPGTYTETIETFQQTIAKGSQVVFKHRDLRASHVEVVRSASQLDEVIQNPSIALALGPFELGYSHTSHQANTTTTTTARGTDTVSEDSAELVLHGDGKAVTISKKRHYRIGTASLQVDGAPQTVTFREPIDEFYATGR